MDAHASLKKKCNGYEKKLLILKNNPDIIIQESGILKIISSQEFPLQLFKTLLPSNITLDYTIDRAHLIPKARMPLRMPNEISYHAFIFSKLKKDC